MLDKDFLYNFMIYGGGLLVTFGLPFLLWYQRQQNRKRYLQSVEPAPIDYETLAQAEEAVKELDLREELLKTHQRIHSFYSLHGIDDNYMYSLIEKFRNEGIGSDFLFVQSMPAGVASYMGSTGVYEFYVESDKMEEGKSLLDRILRD